MTKKKFNQKNICTASAHLTFCFDMRTKWKILMKNEVSLVSVKAFDLHRRRN